MVSSVCQVRDSPPIHRESRSYIVVASQASVLVEAFVCGSVSSCTVSSC
jgi:hypothetical protein